MARRACTRRELLDRWRGIQDDLEDDDLSPSKQQRILRAKEDWFSDSFDFLINLPKENHIWCGCPDLMGPLLETFHNYFKDKSNESPLKLLWKRVSIELGCCSQCVCQHHQAQESYEVEYQHNTVDPLLKILQLLDEERVAQHLKEINTRIRHKEYDPKCHSAEVVSVMFEVLLFPVMLDDYSLSNEFQVFIEAIDDSFELTLSSNQQYPGVYALLFFKSGKARAIGLRLARYMGKLRRATDLEPLQPLLRKYIGFLEMEVLPSTLDNSRPRVQLERANVWLGIKTLLGFLEAPAFEDGILERYPVFLNIVLNHVSDDTSDFSCAVSCLKVSFEMLGCKLWLRTTLSPSVMRNTLLGHCFHTRNEKSHKEIFDLFLPFLQSLEALQDGEHEKQRRNVLYFLLHQVTCSSNFSVLMRKNACKIALLIVQRGYMMNPPSPPFECAHMWGPSLVSSLKDSSLHSSLRQPAFDLINIILISDASALISFKSNHLAASNIDVSNSIDDDDEDEQPFSCDVEEMDNSCWSDFNIQDKLTSQDCKDWLCVPLLWFDTMIQVDCSMLPVSFSKAVFWALSHISLFEPESTLDSSLSVENWLSSYAGDISSTFVWETPKGSDDGGLGKDSRNSVKLSEQCTLLTRTFKRFASHFIMQIEQHELHKQWTWEPRMAESLILLLIDPNDNIRQADRGILEHVSKARGLTSGLQFLCSSASSLSAIFLGLRYALRLVQRNSLLVNFHNLHHLFFVMRKLLKEVVSSPQKSPNTSESVKSLPEGGFLRQHCPNYLPVRPPENSASIVDTVSWNKFSYVLSVITWPFIQKCIEEGKELINSKPCQMTNVRLLEMLPVVYERLNTYSSMPPGSLVSTMPDVLNLTWLSVLVEWGKSSLIVITRHWRQCMLALLEVLKGSHSGIIPFIGATEAIISHDTISIDELKETILNLIVILSKETSGNIGGKIAKQLSCRPSFDKRSVDPERCSARVVHDEGAKPNHAIKDETIIVLSDDETEKMPSNSLVCKEVLLDGRMKSGSTSSLKEKRKPFPSRIFVEDSQLSLQKQGSNVLETSSVSSAVESSGSRSTIIPSKEITTEKGLSKSSSATGTSVSLKIVKLSDKSGHQSSAQSTLISDKGDSIIKEIIQYDEDDPLERARDKSQCTQFLLTKPPVYAPRRQVVQLQLPTRSKSSSLSKMDTCVRRLKPPKLDSWYKDILEIDFFAVVGLSSADGDENKMSNLKEVPLCFDSQNHYVDIFRPLVLEEFKAQLHSSFLENSSDDMASGSLCILSVERIDDFLLVRGRPDGNGSIMSRGLTENDLVLLTKDPLKSSAQNVHVLGKVERREKRDKSQSLIIVIRFYLSNDSSRLNKVRRLLVERSKWFLSRIMSITPQLREFQALSSLHDIPMLPVILNPVNCSLSYPESRKVQLGKLSQPLQKVLMSSFNDSQLQAISIAIGTFNSRRSSELSLIQGPPGTGKTRTIIAIVSALLALPTMRKNYSSKFMASDSKSNNIGCTNSRVMISQSAAIARAWQDAAFAKQVIEDSEKDSFGTTEHSSRGRVLICAQSNAAVDELVSRLNEGLLGIDGKVYKPYIVRVGNAKTVHPNSLPIFIDTLVEQRLVEEVKYQTTARNDTDAESSSALRARLEKVVDSIRYYESKRAKLNDSDTIGKISFDDRFSKEDDLHEVSDEAIGVKLNILYGQKRAICGDLAVSQTREKKLAEESKFLKHKVRKSILRDAEIVLTTLSGSGGDIYGVCSESSSAGRFGNFSEQTLFDVVIIDEAAQALEPATLIPLQLLKSNETKCVMVGDPKQLPATVLSNVASKFLYECSMFERLQRAGHPVIMLTEQYRMHPEICRFPSLHFYENKLLNGAQLASKSAPFHENHLLGPYMFFDIVDGHECYGKNTGVQSLFNDSEADAVIEILKFLRKRYPSEFGYRKIGIITPYRSQLSLLRSRFSSMFGPEVLSDIELNTVDGFQGREVDILFLSTVRASESSVRSSSIGFVADVRRMNVALTRAKFSLWIVGNARTLQTNPHWSALIQNAKERKLFNSIARPYSSIFGKVLSSSKGAGSPILDSYSSKQKQDGKDKGGSSNIQHVRVNTIEGHRGKVKHANKNLDKHTGRRSEDYSLTSPKVIQNLPKISHQLAGDQEQDQGCSEDRETLVAQRRTEGKKASKQNEASTEGLGRDSIVKRVGDRTKVNMPVEKDSNTKSLTKKAKEARKVSEQHKSSKDQGGSSNLMCSEEGNLHQTKKMDKRKSTEFGKQDHLIAERKRQRDAVDSLLSSALISSKRHLSKNSSIKKGR
ncbi:uncharacterized protein [Typha latifolia]|uniref:uncharacterized protein isoform X1 n=2 Tax=Typha latifolia TaxID=4733 RepID=UPI003C2F24D5